MSLETTIQAITKAGFNIWCGGKQFTSKAGNAGRNLTRRVYAPDNSGTYILIDQNGELVNKGMSDADVNYFLEKTGLSLKPKKMTDAQIRRETEKLRMPYPAYQKLVSLVCTLPEEVTEGIFEQELLTKVMRDLTQALQSSAIGPDLGLTRREYCELRDAVREVDVAVKAALRELPGYPY